jgi:hypothetical protein
VAGGGVLILGDWQAKACWERECFESTINDVDMQRVFQSESLIQIPFFFSAH